MSATIRNSQTGDRFLLTGDSMFFEPTVLLQIKPESSLQMPRFLLTGDSISLNQLFYNITIVKAINN